MTRSTPRVSLTEATRLLNSGDRHYSDQEVETILELLNSLAEIEYKNWVRSYESN